GGGGPAVGARCRRSFGRAAGGRQSPLDRPGATSRSPPIAAPPFAPAETTGSFAPDGGIRVRPRPRPRFHAKPGHDNKARNRRARSAARYSDQSEDLRPSSNLLPGTADNRAGGAPAPPPGFRETNFPRAAIRLRNWPRRRLAIAPRLYLAPRQA